MIINVGTDSGKSFTKAMMQLPNGEFVKTIFPTSFEETDTKAAPDGCFEVVYNDVRYIVGEANRKCSREKEGRTKEKLIHKVCTLTAICDVIKKAKLQGAKISDVKTVNITVNMPLSEYLDKNLRQSAISFYNSGKNTSIIVDNVTYSFVINVLPYYEGLGAVLKEADTYKNQRVISIDFGSLNTGYVTLDGLKIVSTNDNDAGTIDFGCSRLLTSVNKLFKDNQVKGITTEAQVLEVLAGNNSFVKNVIVELGREKVLDYVGQIYDALFDLEVGVDSTKILASGGATKLYEEHFNKVFKMKNVVVSKENSEFANAEGSLKLLA